MTLPLIYATKEKGLLVRRDTHIGKGTETIVKIGDRFVVKQRYTLPNKERDGVTLDQVEYIVFYNAANKDSIAIKNPFR